MRRGFFWALAGSLAISAGTVWMSDGPPRVIAAVERAYEPVVAAEVPVSIKATHGGGTALPEQLDGALLEPAGRDIFAPVPPAQEARPAPLPKAAEVAVMQPAASTAPAAPAVTFRYVGRMTTPLGEPLVFLASGSNVLAVKAGDRLDDGYVVESVSEQGVQLSYPALDVRVTIPVPSIPGS